MSGLESPRNTAPSLGGGRYADLVSACISSYHSSQNSPENTGAGVRQIFLSCHVKPVLVRLLLYTRVPLASARGNSQSQTLAVALTNRSNKHLRFY